jgi:predicted metalloendopeptidase
VDCAGLEELRCQDAEAGGAVGAYSPLPGYNVNGELTLGESIGDNSGLAIAYKPKDRVII